MPKLSEIDPSDLSAAPVRLSQVDPAQVQPVNSGAAGGLEGWLKSNIPKPAQDALTGWNSWRSGVTRGATLNNLPEGQAGREAEAASPAAGRAGSMAGSLVPGYFAGQGVGAISKAAGLAGESASIPAAAAKGAVRTGLNVAGAGAQAAAQAPGGGSRVDNAVSTMKNPLTWGLSAAPEALATGADILAGSAGRAQMRALGLTGAKSKNVPEGTGERLIREGVWGTKQGMADKVAEKYADIEPAIQARAETLPGSKPSSDLAQDVRDSASGLLDKATGRPVPGNAAGYKTIGDIADDVERSGAGYKPASTQDVPTEFTDNSGSPITQAQSTQATPGAYNASSLLQLKRAGDQNAFNQSGLMGDTHAADGYLAQANAARQGLRDLEAQAPQTAAQSKLPGASTIQELLGRERDMIYANKGLNQAQMVSKNPVSLSDIGASMVGAASHGLPGAGVATLASKAVMSPLAQSLYAKGALGSSDLLKALSSPEVEQALLGQALQNKSQK